MALFGSFFEGKKGKLGDLYFGLVKDVGAFAQKTENFLCFLALFFVKCIEKEGKNKENKICLLTYFHLCDIII